MDVFVNCVANVPKRELVSEWTIGMYKAITVKTGKNAQRKRATNGLRTKIMKKVFFQCINFFKR